MADKGIGKLAYSHFVSAQYSPLDATAVAIGCIADVLGSACLVLALLCLCAEHQQTVSVRPREHAKPNGCEA